MHVAFQELPEGMTPFHEVFPYKSNFISHSNSTQKYIFAVQKYLDWSITTSLNFKRVDFDWIELISEDPKEIKLISLLFHFYIDDLAIRKRETLF